MNDYGLTRTEKQVKLAMEMGYTTRQIAEFMVVSMETIKTHKRHIKKKMGPDYPGRKKKPLARAIITTDTGEILGGVKVVPIPEEQKENHGTDEVQES